MAFTIFYDGKCPLCAKEIAMLQKKDSTSQLAFEDIYAVDFAERFPNLDWQALNDRIHAVDEQGKIYIGLDVTHKAWSLVGVGWLYAPLRWPIIRTVADAAYLRFAKHRYRISYWLTGQERCETTCESKLR